MRVPAQCTRRWEGLDQNWHHIEVQTGSVMYVTCANFIPEKVKGYNNNTHNHNGNGEHNQAVLRKDVRGSQN